MSKEKTVDTTAKEVKTKKNVEVEEEKKGILATVKDKAKEVEEKKPAKIVKKLIVGGLIFAAGALVGRGTAKGGSDSDEDYVEFVDLDNVGPTED